MHSACTDEPGISYHPVRLCQVAQKAGFRDHPDVQISDALFTHLLNTHRVPNHYAGARHLKRRNTWHAQNALRAAMWLIAVGATTYSGINVVDGMAMSEEARKVARAAEQVNTRYQQATRQLPVTAEDARAMREAIAMADTLEAHHPDLEALFSLVGAAFERQPNLQLKRFDWYASPDLEPGKKGGEPPATQARSMDNYLVSHIRGQLKRFSGSYLEAHSEIEALVDWLRDQPGVRSVTVTRRPLNTRADASIQGAIRGGAQENQAEFELRIATEIDHGTV
ncbi:MAG TPA: hypothetical protein ENK49_05835 [Gammaproteobacteria bacterium]|nr:hypothetical protein [Gammaproteobacteria bacterium]